MDKQCGSICMGGLLKNVYENEPLMVIALSN